MQVLNLKLDGGGGGRGEKGNVERVGGRERGDNVSGIEDIAKQNRVRDSKIVELILLFNVVKLVSLSVQRPILPFL